MRKVLLFATALCLSSSAMAQQDFNSALEAKQGDNTFTVEGEQSDSVFWKFTADKNYLAKVSPLNNSNDVPSVSVLDKDGKQIEYAGAQVKFPVKAFALQKGQTYYFILKQKGESGFNLDLQETASYGKGLSADDPLELELDKEQYLGDPTNTSSYGDSKFYATYTAEKDGQLRMTLSSYMQSATFNGVTVNANYDYSVGGYVLKTSVEAGKTYNITFQLSGSLISKAELVEVMAGSLEAPFQLKEGENTVPAKKGTYYYTYTPQKTGFLQISSDALLPGGQVKIYDSLSNISYNYPKATSSTGSYNVRAEIAYIYGSTYYIEVTKLEDSQADDVFNMEMTDYQPGETEGSAIAINLPTAEIQPVAKGTTYYLLAIPANSQKMLSIETSADLSSGTSIQLYPRGESWNPTNMEYGVIRMDANNTYDTAYILKCTNDETAPLDIKVSLGDFVKGAMATIPADATAGDNTIELEGVEYFSYTATRDGKLSVDVDPGTEVSFPKSEYGSEYTTLVKGTTYSIQATKGTTYLIKVKKAVKGSSIYLEESDFAAGESRNNPIVMEGNSYTFTKDGAANLWLRYDVDEDGVLDFACTTPFDYGNSYIEIAKNESEQTARMMGNETVGTETTTVYKGRITVAKGDKLYIHCSLSGKVEGDMITFTQHEIQQGETLSNPLVLERGKSVIVKDASNETPIWVKVSLPAGDTDLLSNESLAGYLYKTLEDANNDANREDIYSSVVYADANYNPARDENGDMIYKYTQTMQEAGNVYIKYTRAGSSSVKLYLTDTATGISTIEAIGDGKTEVYTLDGTKVAQPTGNGVYIIKRNGKAMKMVIRK